MGNVRRQFNKGKFNIDNTGHEKWDKMQSQRINNYRKNYSNLWNIARDMMKSLNCEIQDTVA